MLLQPNDCKRNDVVQTPSTMVKSIVSYFNPRGKILEPCRGQGNFYQHMLDLGMTVDWCEVSDGRDFFDYRKRVSWIITNPPWSKISPFLEHSFTIADNVVFLMTINHAYTAKRMRLLDEYDFGIRTIARMKWPEKSSGFPRSGFELGCVHYKRGFRGRTEVKSLSF